MRCPERNIFFDPPPLGAVKWESKIWTVNSKYLVSWILKRNTYSPITLQELLYLSFKQLAGKKQTNFFMLFTLQFQIWNLPPYRSRRGTDPPVYALGRRTRLKQMIRKIQTAVYSTIICNMIYKMTRIQKNLIFIRIKTLCRVLQKKDIYI